MWGAVAAFVAPPVIYAWVGAIRAARRLEAPMDLQQERFEQAGAEAAAAAASAEEEDPRWAENDDREVAVVMLSNKGTEVSDAVLPYAILKESRAYRVLTVAPERRPCYLWPGLVVHPDLSFDELAVRFPQGPAVIVVPNILDYEDPILLQWLQGCTRAGNIGGRAIMLVICEGARLAAAAGLLDGRDATTHWVALDSLRGAHRDTNWRRDLRYVIDGADAEVITSAGVTAGQDATLALLRLHQGLDVAEETAARLGIRLPPVDLRSPRFSLSEVCGSTLSTVFQPFWRRRKWGVLLYEGCDEIQVAAWLDCSHRISLASAVSVGAGGRAVRSKRGLLLQPVEDSLSRGAPGEITTHGVERLALPGVAEPLPGEGAGPSSSSPPPPPPPPGAAGGAGATESEERSLAAATIEMQGFLQAVHIDLYSLGDQPGSAYTRALQSLAAREGAAGAVVASKLLQVPVEELDLPNPDELGGTTDWASRTLPVLGLGMAGLAARAVVKGKRPKLSLKFK